jgi:hypothetical protein
MKRSEKGFSRRRSVCAPNVPLFGFPINGNYICTLTDSHNPHMGSLCEDLRATWLGSWIVEGHDQAVWICTFSGRHNRFFVTDVTHDFDVRFLPNRVVEHVAPDPGRVRNQDANLFLFQRIALAAHFFESQDGHTRPSGVQL